MFQQTILSSEESRRPWTFGVSLLAQALFIAVAVLIPLLAKPMLPGLNAAIVSLQLPQPPRAAAPPPPEQVVAVRPQQFSGELRQPTSMPDRAQIITAPMPTTLAGPVILGTLPGAEGGIIAEFVGQTQVASPPQPVVEPDPPTAPIRVSGEVQEARIVRRVVPVYRVLARTARISGTVRLQAIIAVDGSIAELNVVSGHPLLVKAAVDAVKQWIYKPTVLSGQPVPVNTHIEVKFALGR